MQSTLDKTQVNGLATPEEVSELLRKRRQWLYERIHSESLPFPYLKIGNVIRFRWSDIHTYLEKQTHVPKQSGSKGQ